MILLQPNNLFFFYNENTKLLLGSSIFFSKYKVSSSLFFVNSKTIIIPYYISFQKKGKLDYIKYISNFLLLQCNRLYFGNAMRFRINGRGYRLYNQWNHILFKLGYSHVINYTLPVQYEIQKKEKYQYFYKIVGVGIINNNILSNIKSLRIPNIYSKKGIFKQNDIILFKEGKKTFTL